MKRFFIPLYDAWKLFDLENENTPEYKETEATEKKQEGVLKSLFEFIKNGAGAEIKLYKRFIILSRNIRGQGVTITYFAGDESESYPTSHHDAENAEDFIRECYNFIANDHRGQMIIEAVTI